MSHREVPVEELADVLGVDLDEIPGARRFLAAAGTFAQKATSHQLSLRGGDLEDHVAAVPVTTATEGRRKAFALGPANGPADGATIREAGRLGFFVSHSGDILASGGGPYTMDRSLFGAKRAHQLYGSPAPVSIGLPFADGQIPSPNVEPDRRAILQRLRIRQMILGEDINAVYALGESGDGTEYELLDHVVHVSRGLVPFFYPISTIEPTDAGHRLYEQYVDNLAEREQAGSVRAGTRFLWRVALSAKEAVKHRIYWDALNAGIELDDDPRSRVHVLAPWKVREGTIRIFQHDTPVTDDELQGAMESLEDMASMCPDGSKPRQVERVYRVDSSPMGPHVALDGPRYYPVLANMLAWSLTEAAIDPRLAHSFDDIAPLPKTAEVDGFLNGGGVLLSADLARTSANGAGSLMVPTLSRVER